MSHTPQNALLNELRSTIRDEARDIAKGLIASELIAIMGSMRIAQRFSDLEAGAIVREQRIERLERVLASIVAPDIEATARKADEVLPGLGRLVREGKLVPMDEPETKPATPEDRHRSPCECWDGCGACDGCGRAMDELEANADAAAYIRSLLALDPKAGLPAIAEAVKICVRRCEQLEREAARES